MTFNNIPKIFINKYMKIISTNERKTIASGPDRYLITPY